MGSGIHKPGAWIFLSHSNHDFEEVRRLRDLLETMDAKPIMFFLKCLSDHPNDEELWGLIRREIAARDWFIHCDSPNAQASVNVRREKEIIECLPEKLSITIEVQKDLEPQIFKINALLKRATVFLSYSRHDENKARVVRQVLEEHNYAIHKCEFSPGTNWKDEIREGIAQTVDNGFFMPLLSESFLASEYTVWETQVAFEHAASTGPKANIIPVGLSDFSILMHAMPQNLQFLLSRIQISDFAQGDIAENMRKLISQLKTRPME